MRIPGLTKSENKGGNSAPHSKDETGQALNEFFRFRPVDYLRLLQSQRAQENRGDSDDNSKPALPISGWFLLAGSIAFVAALYFKKIDANTVIAIFTIVMAYITWFNWRAMVDQNGIMIQQNEGIKKQLDTIELQQRAWLAASPVDILPLGPDAYGDQQSAPLNDWGITITNTGHTPAFILASHFNAQISGNDAKWDQELRDCEDRARQYSFRRVVVAPGQSVTYKVGDGGGSTSWSMAACKEILGGSKSGAIVGAFIYRDVFGKEHKTLCAFFYSNVSNKLTNNYQHGDMT